MYGMSTTATPYFGALPPAGLGAWAKTTAIVDKAATATIAKKDGLRLRSVRTSALLAVRGSSVTISSCARRGSAVSPSRETHRRRLRASRPGSKCGAYSGEKRAARKGHYL